MSENEKLETTVHGNIVPLSIEKELRTSFLDYAMSVIVSRALPDVRDGLKPVHRRILYAMHTLSLTHDRPYRKSATVVGEVIGHYHPHGDSPIYQSMVGLVQDFSKRYPLLDGQGNWGSIDGDNAAAFRYTEVRMAKIARELLADIEKNTVQFIPNFDESKLEPVLLPSKIPHLLINGSNGIAVGMATSIPPHNLLEVVNACIALLKNDDISDDELFALMPGPDFPTGGIICGRGGIVKAYRTGHGSCIVRGVVDIEENAKQTVLVITEIPYQVNKADLITKIADLTKNKIIEGISNIRDESTKKGIRIVIDLRRGEIPQVVLNQLYKHTSLQTSISIMLLALLDNRPVIFTLREMLYHFLQHRRQIITRRSEFDLAKHQARLHILEGLLKALKNIDEIIVVIKASQATEDASKKLQEQFAFSEIQAKSILEMRLSRLTGLEVEKIVNEQEEIKKIITELLALLNNPEILTNEIITELELIKKQYTDVRRTRIEGSIEGFSEKDLIPDDEVVVTLTRKGYIKRVAIDTYALQHRGGKGKRGMADLDDSDDVMEDLFVAKNHDELLFFTNKGRIYTMHVYQIPEGSRTAKGRAIINIVPLTEGEKVVKMLCTRGMQNKYLVMVTKAGVIKKTPGTAFAKVRSTGIIAIGLRDNDELVFCGISSGNDSIVLATSKGQGIHFKETEIRSMGRQAAGVRGIKLKAKDFVVGMEIIADNRDLLFATERGYGKRVAIEDFRVAHRGGLGVRTIPVDKRNGEVIGVARVSEESHILLIDENGKIIRLSPQEVRTMGRQAKGVRLIRLDEKQVLSGIVSFEESDNEKELTLQPSLDPNAPMEEILDESNEALDLDDAELLDTEIDNDADIDEDDAE
jgi:DNA gyrase subunit A